MFDLRVQERKKISLKQLQHKNCEYNCAMNTIPNNPRRVDMPLKSIN